MNEIHINFNFKINILKRGPLVTTKFVVLFIRTVLI